MLKHSPSSNYDEALKICERDNPDFNHAWELLKDASAQGDARASYAISTWYIWGKEGIIDKDERLAISILKNISENHISEALFQLAFAYDNGRSVRRNEHKAFSLYMRAALLGDRDACNQVAEFYREGKIVPRDLSLSRAWATRGRCDEKEISPPYRLLIKAS